MLASWFFATGGASRLVVSTSNEGKLREISVLLRGHIEEIRSLSDFSRAEIAETGMSYEANALLKARAGFERSGWASLGDDSGFEVSGLDGRPGLHSARWARTSGGGMDFSHAIARVEKELKQKGFGKGFGEEAGSSARFVCALALVRADGAQCVVEGEVVGKVVFPGRGEHGFGYDPIFVAAGERVTFAEMNIDAKERISHRGVAFRKLCARCFSAAG